MGEIILAISIIVQAWAGVQAVRLALRHRHVAWVFLALGTFLMLGRRVVSYLAAFSDQRATDPVAESVALLISLLMAIGMTLLLRWRHAPADESDRSDAIMGGALRRLQRQSILLALLALFGCAVLGSFAYDKSRDGITERLLKGSLDLAHLLETAVRGAPDRDAATKELQRLWRDSRSQYPDNYLCVIGGDGRLILNTRRPEKIGVFVGATPIPTLGSGPKTVQELVKARADWGGRNRNSEGEPQIAAYAYSASLDSLVAVHLPASHVDGEIRAAALPWVLGIAIVVTVVLPLSFGLLYYVGASSQSAALRALGRQSESERRYSLLIENVKDHSIFLLDPKGHVTTWNPGAESLRGWKPTEIRDRHLSLFYTEEDRMRKLPEQDLAAAEKNGRLESEGWRLRQDGTRFWAGITISSIRGSDGALSGFLVVTRDITERKRWEAALRESEERLRILTDNARVGLVLVDRERRYVFANAAYGEIVGQPVANIAGRSVKEVLGDIYEEHIRPRLDRAFAGEHVVYEFERPTPAGPRHLEIKYDPIRTENAISRVAAVILDITERVRAEAATRRSDALLRSIVDTSPHVLFAKDADSRILMANEAVGGFYGLSAAEVIGQLQSDLHARHGIRPDEIEKWLADDRRVIETGIAIESEETGTDNTGATLHFQTGKYPLDLQDGRRGVLVISQDVTERKNAEEQVRRLNRTYAVLSDINQLIVRERNPQRLLDEACRAAVAKGGFRMAWIGMADETERIRDIAAHAGASEITLQRLHAILNPGTGACGCTFTERALRTGSHAICNDIENDPEAAPWRDAALRRDYQSMTSLPIKSAGKLVGTFNLYADAAGFFDAEEMRLLDELAVDIGFALEVSQREKERHQADEKLRAQLDELLRWQSVMLVREDRVQELKAEVNELLSSQGRPIRYPSQEQP
jgi:PAS domain S-box-containing protein